MAWRVLRHEVADHERKERIVRDSGLDWTMCGRRSSAEASPAAGRYRSGDDIAATGLLPRLARADVADFILEELGDPRFVRRAPALFP